MYAVPLCVPTAREREVRDVASFLSPAPPGPRTALDDGKLHFCNLAVRLKDLLQVLDCDVLGEALDDDHCRRANPARRRDGPRDGPAARPAEEGVVSE